MTTNKLDLWHVDASNDKIWHCYQNVAKDPVTQLARRECWIQSKCSCWSHPFARISNQLKLKRNGDALEIQRMQPLAPCRILRTAAATDTLLNRSPAEQRSLFKRHDTERGAEASILHILKWLAVAALQVEHSRLGTGLGQGGLSGVPDFCTNGRQREATQRDDHAAAIECKAPDLREATHRLQRGLKNTVDWRRSIWPGAVPQGSPRHQWQKRWRRSPPCVLVAFRACG